MASKKTKFVVGLFISSGLLLAVILTIWLGAAKFLTKSHYAVTFFDESVQGLTVDAPVKYRGVMIGRVDKIGVASDGTLIKVTLKLESDRDRISANLDSLVSQLRSVGITGSMFVELDKPKREEKLFMPGPEVEAEYPVIPSKHSEIVNLLSSMSDIVEQVKKLNIHAIGDSLVLLLEKLNDGVDSMNVQELSENIKQFLAKLNKAIDEEKIRSILAHADEAAAAFESVVKSFSSNTQPVEGIITELNIASQKLNKIFNQIESVTDKTDVSIEAVTRYVLVILRQLEYLMDNMEKFTAKIADQPSQLFFGNAPPEDGKN